MRRQMMATPGKLTVGSDGRIRGPASIEYSVPFPVPNGTPGGSGVMQGVVMHTEVGYDHNVVAEFENPASQASAWFSVRDDGHITQYGPVGQNWMAWAQEAGNPSWYSIEHEDHGDPRNPLTDAQIAASAQLLECLSAYAGFPLQEANTPQERGYGVHYMGGPDWGDHTCPDVPPTRVRSLQRPAIIELAKTIRSSGSGPPRGPFRHTANGSGDSLEAIAAARGTTPDHLLRVSAVAFTPDDINAIAKFALPAGTPYYTSEP
jgi:N-acetylmuramoyl-L-alanine amidase